MAAAGFSGRLTIALAGLLAAACAPAGPPGGAPIAELAGTSWRVAAVNGRSTPATGDYSIRFEDGGIGARFGCNSMGGKYRLQLDVLTVGDLAQTLMGCPEPAGTFESQGAAVLGQPMKIAFDSNDRLFLSNAAGSIVLEPIP